MDPCRYTDLLPYPVAQGIRLPSGSSNAPSYSFSEDNRTGLYLPGQGELSLVTDLKPRLRMNAATISIGDADNVCALDVHGKSSLHGNVIVEGASTLQGQCRVLESISVGADSNATTSSPQGMVLLISGGQNNTGAGILSVDRATYYPVFNVYASGDAKARGAITGGGADYAEYFEWDDGNINNEDRAGETVVFVQNTCKIRIAKPDDPPEDIIGVVSCSPAIIGNEVWSHWKGMFLKDDYNRDIYGDVEYATWVDSNGETISIRKDINTNITIPDYATSEFRSDVLLNPKYNSNVPYIPRSQRVEWCLIGLMGVLRINRCSFKNPRWKFIQTISSNVEEWLL